MHGLMFLFIVDILVGCHLVKDGESRITEALTSTSSHQAQIRPGVFFLQGTGCSSLHCLGILANITLHTHACEVVVGVVLGIIV